ncbi:hypothetical protein AXG93_4421s1120 [Marchantia polymorpha subsp. ruderalis]|uniref:Uncharacterized protein n=1 Tax=Marchantia polymorpha subsp. ruderalis TaxID=1480154 RepID=A0A176WHA4_MARPO|nr:hypothetical protein AXG93_4421s1120 [Marchantia polymorpha subsp. ruderalis]
MEGNEVVSDDDDVEFALTSAEVDMSDDDIVERLAKRRRKLQMPSASEIVRQNGLQTRISTLMQMRTTSTHLRNKMKARRRGKKEVDSTECSEATSVFDKTYLNTRAEFENMMTPWGEVTPNRVVTEIEKTIAKQPTVPSCQVSSDTIEFDRGEKSLRDEPKLAEFSLADLLSDRIVT